MANSLYMCDFLIGGWDPEWDKFKKPLIRRPYKGHKNERTRDDRYER